MVLMIDNVDKMEPRKDETAHLTSLGAARTEYQYSNPNKAILETFPNQYPERGYVIEFKFPEFSSLCPKTGQPDFGVITIEYIPGKFCIETKSLKLYFLAFRQYGSFMETIVNRVLEDCAAVCQPRWMRVAGRFNTRGGIEIIISAETEEPRKRGKD